MGGTLPVERSCAPWPQQKTLRFDYGQIGQDQASGVKRSNSLGRCTGVTLGLYRIGVWRESKVIRLLSIIHNGIILDLVCGFRW